MAHLNRIELIGCVGAVNVDTVNGQTHNRFSLAVDTRYGSVIHTDWFQCVYWGESDKIVRGNDIHIEGRLQVNKYADSEGVPHSYIEVKVNKIW